MMATTALYPLSVLAGDLPTGGQVVSGGAQIARPGEGRMTVNQSSDRAIINWQGFSVGQGNRVDFVQPGRNSAVLNRVTGPLRSRIDGTVSANGEVFLVNPSGIVVGPSGRVDAGGFVASTLDIDNEDFREGRLVFRGGGASAAVANHGTIAVRQGGMAALLGGKVSNTGTITAPLGRIGMGAGEQATLDLTGDGFLQIALPSETEEEVLIEQAGRVSADGGQVEIEAATAKNAARRVVNLSGVTEARSVSGRNGAITLGAGPGGTVRVQGRVSTSQAPSALLVEASPRPSARPPGGEILVTGERIELALGAEITADAPSGGGRIRIGGDIQGQGPLPRAAELWMADTATVSADATEAGDGGSIVLWADTEASVYGSLSARGGPEGGDGGFVEVSSPSRLAFAGEVSAGAPRGAPGTFLLDPTDILVCDAGPDCVEGTFGVYTTEQIEDILNGPDPTDVRVKTFGEDEVDPGSGFNFGFFFGEDGDPDGDIDVTGDLAWTSDARLEFDASDDIVLDGITITAPNGDLQFFAFDTIFPDADITVGRMDVFDGDWVQVVGRDVAIDRSDGSTDTFSLTALPTLNVTDFRLESSDDFLRATGGDGSAGSPWQIADVYGLQGVGSGATSGDAFVLANDIDASGTSGWFDLVEVIDGFRPLGGEDSDFGGTFDGQGNTISNLFTAWRDPALFGSVDDAVIRNVNVTNALVSFNSGEAAGILVAEAFGGATQISNVVTSGTVSVDSFTGGDRPSAGGIVGILFGGTVTGSSSSATVETSGSTSENVRFGGLVGAPGPGSTISASEALGQVSADFFVTTIGLGGLVGSNEGTIEASRAAATVNAVYVGDGGDGVANLGGFAGSNSGSLRATSSSGQVDGEASSSTSYVAGGHTGRNTGLIEDSYATGNVSAAGPDAIVGGFVGQEGSGTTINRSLSRGVPSAPGGGTVGGFAGTVVGSGSVNGSFWDVTTSGVGAPDEIQNGALGLTTDRLQDTVDFLDLAGEVGWNFATTWAPGAPGTYPQLYAVDPVIFATPEPAPIEVAYGETAPDTVGGTFVGGPEAYRFAAPGDSVSEADVFAGFEIEDGLDVGPYVVGGQSTVAATPSGETYGVIYRPTDVDVVPRPLTITADDVEKTYGTSLPPDALTFSTEPDALVEGDSLDSVALTTPEGGPAADDPVGDYPIVPSDAEGTGLDNYTIDFVNGTLTVVEAALTITATDQTKQATDEAFSLGDQAFTTEGLLPFDSVDSVTLTSAGEPPTAEPGAYAIVPSAAQGSGLDNYDISFVDGTLTVIGSELVIRANDQVKIYGDLGFSLGSTAFEAIGLEAGDSVSSVTLTSAGEAATAGIGPYDIVPSDAVGTGLEGYSISYQIGTLVVEPAELIVRTADQSKVYGDPDFALDQTAFTVEGLRNADTVTAVTLTSEGEPVTAPVAGYPILPSDPVGTGLSNYVLTPDPGPLSVTPAELRIIAGDQSKVYGQPGFALDPGAFTTQGLRNADTVTSVALDSPGAAPSAPVGSAPITPSAPQGTGLGNYTVVPVDGTLSIAEAPLTIVADDQQKLEGRSFTFDGTEFSVQGLRPGDSVESASLSSPGAAPGAAAEDSPFPIFIGGAVGDGLTNYDIDFVEGSFLVRPRVVGPDDPEIGIIIPPGLPGLPNPTDTFTGREGIRLALADGVGAGPAGEGGIAFGTGTAVTATGSVEVAQTTLQAITDASDSLVATAQGCRETEEQVTDFLGCISEALESYSAALDPATLELPEALETVSASIVVARRGIDAAIARAESRLEGVTDPEARRAIERQAIAEARAALQTAEAEVTKAITLIRADDPELASAYRAQANVVLATLDAVDLELQRAVGL